MRLLCRGPTQRLFGRTLQVQSLAGLCCWHTLMCHFFAWYQILYSSPFKNHVILKVYVFEIGEEMHLGKKSLDTLKMQ